MVDAQSRYFGTYCQLESDNDTTHITLDGNMIVIGRELHLTQERHLTQRAKEVERVIVNVNDTTAVGFLPNKLAHRIIKLFDAGWLCHVAASLVVYDKLKDQYRVEVVLVCYPRDEHGAFDMFTRALFERVAKGERPAVALSEKQLEQIVKSGGSWCGTQTLALPALDKGSAIYKSRRTKTEQLAARAATNPTGCWLRIALSIIIVVVVIVAIIIWFSR